MTFEIPLHTPNYRFMRYVRPPTEDASIVDGSQSLFPLQPAVRRMRVGIDVESISQLTPELLTILKRRDEIAPILLVRNGDKLPSEWIDALGSDKWFRFGFSSVEEASRFGDTCEVGVEGFEDGRRVSFTRGSFFDIYAQLDDMELSTEDEREKLTLEERHREAAITAAAAALGTDVIISNERTAERSDVYDNDLVLTIKSHNFDALFGHYLRVTGNPEIAVSSGNVVGGGTYRVAHHSGSISDQYSLGVASVARHLDAIQLMAGSNGDQILHGSILGISTRLRRAARAVDVLLASLSNRGKTDWERIDVTESTAEAFDRMLVYLMGALDRYARLTEYLFDMSKDPDEIRNGTLASGKALEKIIKNFDKPNAEALWNRHLHARISSCLRNQIHALPLENDYAHSRGYGSGKTVVLVLEDLLSYEIDPEKLNQQQFDSLGIWVPDNRNMKSENKFVADIATFSTTLFQEVLGYVEEFSRFLLYSKPLEYGTAGVHPLLGAFSDDPRPFPEPFGKEVLYSKLFGWGEGAVGR